MAHATVKTTTTKGKSFEWGQKFAGKGREGRSIPTETRSLLIKGNTPRGEFRGFTELTKFTENEEQSERLKGHGRRPSKSGVLFTRTPLSKIGGGRVT